MSAIVYQEPKLSAAKRAALEQGFFDFLVPYRSDLIRPDQAALSLRGERDKLSFVYAMIAEGRLETLQPQSREKARVMILTRSLKLLVAEQYHGALPGTRTRDGEPADFMSRVEALLPNLSAAQLGRLITAATALRTKL